jgi:hypothetical protein
MNAPRRFGHDQLGLVTLSVCDACNHDPDEVRTIVLTPTDSAMLRTQLEAEKQKIARNTEQKED